MEPVQNPDGSVTLPLEYPVTVALKNGRGGTEDTIVELRLRRITGADIEAIAGAKPEAIPRILIPRLAGVPVLVYDRMDLTDITRAATVIQGFSQPSPATGDGS
jgi:hypothetical protein